MLGDYTPAQTHTHTHTHTHTPCVSHWELYFLLFIWYSS